MRRFFWKWRYWLRGMAIFVMTIVGAQACNHALYNVWQSAFADNAPNAGQLSFRFWLYVTVAVIAFSMATLLLIRTIRQMNRAYRHSQEARQKTR